MHWPINLVNNMIRPVSLDDAPRIAEIYNYYVTDTVITFEEEIVSADEYVDRIKNVLSKGLPWIVAEVDGKLVGYAYATEWRTRVAYRFTVETAVYLDHQEVGNGSGSALYRALIEELKSRGFKTIMGLVALPNPVSQKLHEKFGFKKVGEYKQVGRKFDRWIDVGSWQLMLDQENHR